MEGFWRFLTLVKPCNKSKNQFGHCFTFDAHTIWNELCDDLCAASSFRKKHKLYLFSKSFPPQFVIQSVNLVMTNATSMDGRSL